MKAKAYARRVRACIPAQRAANVVWADKLERCLDDGRESKACLRAAYKAYLARIGKKCSPLLKDEK